ncbi:deoxyribonuclease IV [Nocardia sp. NPDC050406]|uniref:deoxyribonuclease IV n=1 Tax=Nocardia sp. NPDC050406 TaxID=3364318 RepID=UPI0037A2C96A
MAERSRIGSHVAVSGGLVKVGLREAREVGAEIVQLFAGNPRGWAQSSGNAREDMAFREACGELDIDVVVHAPHLLNFGSPDPETVRRSAEALGGILRRAESLGATAVVVHTGSSVRADLRASALAGLHDTIAPLVDAAPATVRVLVEPTAGGGAALASTIDSTLEYLDALDDARVGVCLDTCHLHAAGEDLSDPDRLPKSIAALTDSIGTERLGLIHVNDSRDPAGSRRDRHESLGKGTIGEVGLSKLFSIPQLRGVPLLVETPTHREDVAVLARLRDAATRTG